MRVLKRIGVVLLVAAALGAAGLGGFVAWRHWSRPPRTAETRPLADGIVYQRRVRSRPRPLMIHVARVDLKTPGLVVRATPPSPSPGHTLRAATVSEFLVAHQLDLAINADGWKPWRPGIFLLQDFYPHSGDPVSANGITVSDGVTYGRESRPACKLCFLPGRAVITHGEIPAGTLQAVSGQGIVRRNGAPTVKPPRPGEKLHPRTAVALSADGTVAWFIVVDGRQWLYSEGMSLIELAALARELGARDAINLDGGGSSAMAIASPDGPRVLNSPIHPGLPLRERPVANHLGIRVRR